MDWTSVSTEICPASKYHIHSNSMIDTLPMMAELLHLVQSTNQWPVYQLHELLHSTYAQAIKQVFASEVSTTRMWADAQHDGRPAEYRWRPLFNGAKFGWRPLLECCAVTLPRRKTRWNYLGCPKLTKWSQLLVGRSSPYCEDMWRRYCCLTSFFRLSTNALVAKT